MDNDQTMDLRSPMAEFSHESMQAMADYINSPSKRMLIGTTAHIADGSAVIMYDAEEKLRMPESVYRLLRAESEAKYNRLSPSTSKEPRNRHERRSRAAKRRRK